MRYSDLSFIRIFSPSRRATSATRMPPRFMMSIRFTLTFIFMLMEVTKGLKQKWTFEDETRRHFLIERFGFDVHGLFQAQVQIPKSSAVARTSILFVHVRVNL
jgi:hypothetical protein